MNCRKCGAELHPDQKVCIACGARTAAGGGFDYGEEQKWRPSKQMIQVAVGAIVLLLLIVITYKALHVTPPEEVAKAWFGAMLQRQTNTAREYVTPKVEADLQARMMDLRALADEYNMDMSQGTYKVSAPAYSGSGASAAADITISIIPPGGAVGRDVRIHMVKVGRAWKINEIV